MRTADIRERFLRYFEGKRHRRVDGSSLVPADDPSLLFTNAGMVQFKDLFLGNETRDYHRATTVQRCVRAGGKHNDLENVGYTARHHTFFEMLGNFSFGDYFKRDAIRYAWEFLTVELGLPAERLWVTVYVDDDEAAEVWLNDIGVEPERLSRIAGQDNFWAMGDTGPCGPCSEIFYDHGDAVAGGPPGTPEQDGDRYVEIWNLVFMQYDRAADGEMQPLPSPSVDTGMGLERIAAVLQGVHDNYHTDQFDHLISAALEWVTAKDKGNQSLRVLADHIRSCAFLLADGVTPSNEGRGYVLRRIIRRAIRHGYSIGAQTPFFHRLVAPLIEEMGAAYPMLTQSRDKIERALQDEELRFAETLGQGMKILEQKIADLSADLIPGDVAFLLYDTYGFPLDLTADVARERGLQIDVEGFEKAMQAQRDRGRASNQFGAAEQLSIDVDRDSEFLGYRTLADSAKVLSILVDGKPVDAAEAGAELALVIDRTPFYAESGGQVGDTGQFKAANAVVDVQDTQKHGSGAIVHYGKLRIGELKVGDEVQASVDASRRAATAANHSATHLMHAALKRALGAHAEQKGSLVNDEKLRFDFAHSKPVSREQLEQIEDAVNAEIFADHEVATRTMPLQEARAAGAVALFGEKYDDQVRVVAMGETSLELCGGTHVSHTGEIGLFKIVSESSVAASIRRIEAVTRDRAYQLLRNRDRTLMGVADGLNVAPDKVGERVVQLQARIKQLEKEKSQLQATLAGGGASDLDVQVKQVGEVKLLAARMDGMDVQVVRETIDRYRDKLGAGVVVIGAELEGKARLFAGVSKSIAERYPAGQLIKHLTELGGGRGGGRPDMAEGGVSDGAAIDQVLRAAADWVAAR